MSNLIFPWLRGVAWGTKLTPTHNFTKTVSRSGREISSQFSSQPRTKISISFSNDGFLSAAPGKPLANGAAVYSDFEAMLGFFNYHGGGAQSFLFQGVNERERKAYTRQGELQMVGDGATTTFQLVRRIGIFSEWIFNPIGVPAVYVGGVLQAAGNVTALGNGQYQLAAAPALNALVTANFTFAYRCRFDEEEIEFTNWIDGMWWADTPLITVKP